MYILRAHSQGAAPAASSGLPDHAAGRYIGDIVERFKRCRATMNAQAQQDDECYLSKRRGRGRLLNQLGAFVDGAQEL